MNVGKKQVDYIILKNSKSEKDIWILLFIHQTCLLKLPLLPILWSQKLFGLLRVIAYSTGWLKKPCVFCKNACY